MLEEKIPPKIFLNLKKAFGKAFEIVFEKGNTIIEKTYTKEELEKDFQIQDFAFDLKGKRKELKKTECCFFKRKFQKSDTQYYRGGRTGDFGNRPAGYCNVYGNDFKRYL